MNKPVKHSTTGIPVADTLPGLLQHWRRNEPQEIWLSEQIGTTAHHWTWEQAAQESLAVGSWLEHRFGTGRRNIAILSRNCAHWMLADLAILSSGNVTVPIFTTQTNEISLYILNFAEIELLFLGQTENWEKIREILPDHVTIVRCPDAPEIDSALTWDEIFATHRGQEPIHVSAPDDLATIVFTSGTTGLPKGVMHSQRTLIGPMARSASSLRIEQFDRFLSYLPLSHLAERSQIFVMSLLFCGHVTFMQDRTTLLGDMRACRPTFFFGAPRIWEQLQHAIFEDFGGPAAYQTAWNTDRDATIEQARSFLGFSETRTLLSASAPISKALLEFFGGLGLIVIEGFGQTEAMGISCTTHEDMRLGSIGKPVPGVKVRLSDQGELLVLTEDASGGYYKDPQKTAETFVDGWVHTGDKVHLDEDGFLFIVGRIKDYFKTIHGKFVAPVPIEDAFAKSHKVDQRCLLGRGFSKTVLVVTPSPGARSEPRDVLTRELIEHVEAVNVTIEKHARIGAIIVSNEEWSIENGFLTTTLKMKRDRVEEEFSKLAQALACEAAEQRQIIIRFVG